MIKFPNYKTTSAQEFALEYVGLSTFWKGKPLNTLRVITILANHDRIKK